MEKKVNKSALITGGAGFIGSHLVDALLHSGWDVTVLDNFDPFYDSNIKKRNIKRHLQNPLFHLKEVDCTDYTGLNETLTGDYDVIVHLAARAGVRPSIKNPISYQKVNVEGTQNLLEFAKLKGVKQFVFASSSSVYGVNPDVPWSEEDYVLQPISPYASTKISAELLGHVYSKLYGIRFIALRFFTVYGPRQRPDLAIHKFVRLITNGEPIHVYGDGSTRRDYTFISDIISGIRAAMVYDRTSYEVINLGNNQTVSLAKLIATIEEVTGLEAQKIPMPEQPGDVPQTWASVKKAKELLGYSPTVDLKTGLEAFYSWYVTNMQNSSVTI